MRVRRGRNVEIEEEVRGESLLDPLTNTLDDIADERGISKKWIVSRKRKAELESIQEEDENVIEVQNDDRWRHVHVSLTPYRVVGMLSEKGMIIELKIGKLETELFTHPKWRCVVTCGTMSGIADSKRKVVAREMACNNFLTTLKMEYPAGRIPRYDVSSQLFVDPSIFGWITSEAKSQGVDVYYEISLKEVERKNLRRGNPKYEYMCRYYVGESIFEGYAVTSEYARLEAARVLYEAVRKEPYRPTSYIEGLACNRDLYFDFSESEVYHTLDVDEGEIDNELPTGIFHTLTNDDNSALGKFTKRKALTNFEQTQEDDFNRRRFQPVVFPDSGEKSTAAKQPETSKPPIGRGRGRGRVSVQPIVYDL